MDEMKKNKLDDMEMDKVSGGNAQTNSDAGKDTETVKSSVPPIGG